MVGVLVHLTLYQLSEKLQTKKVQEPKIDPDKNKRKP